MTLLSPTSSQRKNQKNDFISSALKKKPTLQQAKQQASKRPPLHTAVAHNRCDKIKKRFAKGDDPNIQDGEGDTPLHFAIKLGRPKFQKIINYLLTTPLNLKIQNNEGDTPLHTAIKQDDFITAWQILSIAVTEGITISNNSELTPLTVTSLKTQDTLLHGIISIGCVPTTELLIQAGANINAKNKAGVTPIFGAIASQNLQIVMLLHQKNTQLDAFEENIAMLRHAINMLNRSHAQTYIESLKIILFFITVGIQTTEANVDLLRCINSEHYYHLVKMYQVICAQESSERLHHTIALSCHKLECFLHAFIKLFDWKQHVVLLHHTFKVTLNQILIQEENLLQLSEIAVQHYLICYLEKHLAAYNPQNQLESDIPEPLKHLPDIANSIHTLYLTVLKNAKGIQAFEKSWNTKESSLQIFHTEAPTKNFINRLHHILAQYIEKTLPNELEGHWQANVVHTASSMMGLDNILIKGWSKKLPAPVLSAQCKDACSSSSEFRLR